MIEVIFVGMVLFWKGLVGEDMISFVSLNVVGFFFALGLRIVISVNFFIANTEVYFIKAHRLI